MKNAIQIDLTVAAITDTQTNREVDKNFKKYCFRRKRMFLVGTA